MIFRLQPETTYGVESRLIYEKLDPVPKGVEGDVKDKKEKKDSTELISDSKDAKAFVIARAREARASLEKKTTSWKQGFQENDDDFRNDTLYQTGLLEIKKIEQRALHGLDAIKADDVLTIQKITREASDSLGELLNQKITSHTSTYSFEVGQFSKELEEVFAVLDEAKLDWTGWSMAGENEKEVSPQETRIKEKFIEIFSDPVIQKYVEEKRDNPFLVETQSWIGRFSFDRSAYSVSDKFVEELIKTLDDKKGEVKKEAQILKEKETIESAQKKLKEWNGFFKDINTNLQGEGEAVIERPVGLLQNSAILQYEQALSIDDVGRDLVTAIQAHMNSLLEEWGKRGNATTDSAIKDTIQSWEKEDSAENRLSQWNQDFGLVADGLETAQQVSEDLKAIVALIVEAEKKAPEVTPVNTAIDKVATAAQAILDTTSLTSDQKNALATALTELKAQLANGSDEIKGQITKLEGQLNDQNAKIEDLKKEIGTLKLQLEFLKTSAVSTQTIDTKNKSPEGVKKTPEKKEDKYQKNWSKGELTVDTSLTGKKYDVTASSLNVRDQNGNKIGLLHSGDEVTIIDGEGRQVIKEKFVKVRYDGNGKEGWVALSFLRPKNVGESKSFVGGGEKSEIAMDDKLKKMFTDYGITIDSAKMEKAAAAVKEFALILEPLFAQQKKIMENPEFKEKTTAFFKLITEDSENKDAIHRARTELETLITKLQSEAKEPPKSIEEPQKSPSQSQEAPKENPAFTQFKNRFETFLPAGFSYLRNDITVADFLKQIYESADISRDARQELEGLYKETFKPLKNFYKVDQQKITVLEALYNLEKQGVLSLKAFKRNRQESMAEKIVVEQAGGRIEKPLKDIGAGVFENVIGHGIAESVNHAVHLRGGEFADSFFIKGLLGGLKRIVDAPAGLIFNKNLFEKDHQELAEIKREAVKLFKKYLKEQYPTIKKSEWETIYDKKLSDLEKERENLYKDFEKFANGIPQTEFASLKGKKVSDCIDALVTWGVLDTIK